MYLTILGHRAFSSLTVNIIPKNRWKSAINPSTSSEVPALGCFSYPMLALWHLLSSMCSMLVVTATTVSRENPQMPLTGLIIQSRKTTDSYILGIPMMQGWQVKNHKCLKKFPCPFPPPSPKNWEYLWQPWWNLFDGPCSCQKPQPLVWNYMEMLRVKLMYNNQPHDKHGF